MASSNAACSYKRKKNKNKTHSLPEVPAIFESFTVFYSKPFQYHLVHAVVLLMHPKCMEKNNLSQVCVDLFLWRQKQESNRCSVTSEDSQKQAGVVDSVLPVYSERSLFFN